MTLARELVHRTVELAHVAQRDRRALLAEAPGGGESDPAGSPGDERTSSVQEAVRHGSSPGRPPRRRRRSAASPRSRARTRRRPATRRGRRRPLLCRNRPEGGSVQPSGDSAWCSKPTGVACTPGTTSPGHTALARMPCGAPSAAKSSETATAPAFVTEYGRSRGSRGCPSRSRCGSSSRRPARAWSRNRHGRRGTAP